MHIDNACRLVGDWPSLPNELQQGAATFLHSIAAIGGRKFDAALRDEELASPLAALYSLPAGTWRIPALQVARLAVSLTPVQLSGSAGSDKLRSFTVARYTMFLTPAGRSAVWRHQGPSRQLVIFFRAEETFVGSQQAPPLTDSNALDNFTVPGLRPLIDQLTVELQHPDAYTADVARGLAHLLLIQVARQLQQRDAGSKELSAGVVAKLSGYTLQHLHQRILVSDLAAQAGMSVDRLSHAFKVHMGKSPHQFLLALRLERACALLKDTELLLVQIAQDCGFCSQQHLTNAMRRNLGITPARYRDKCRRSL